jgi:hypothetical protein
MCLSGIGMLCTKFLILPEVHRIFEREQSHCPMAWYGSIHYDHSCIMHFFSELVDFWSQDMNILLITTLSRWLYAPSKNYMLCSIVPSHSAHAVNSSLLLISCGKFLQYTHFVCIANLTIRFPGCSVRILPILQHNSNGIRILCTTHMFSTRTFLPQNLTVVSHYEVNLWLTCEKGLTVC